MVNQFSNSYIIKSKGEIFMNRRLSRSFNDLINKNKLEIERDPRELDRIERKIDDKHTKPVTPAKKKRIG
jgi:hypothetical protein